MAPDSLQEPLKNNISFWIDFLAKTAPQNGSKNNPKNRKKLVPTMIKKQRKIKQFLDPKMDPKIDPDLQRTQRSQSAGAILKALVSKMAPRLLKMAPRSPR